MWGTCSTSTPACCSRDAFSSSPVNSAPYVPCYQHSHNTPPQNQKCREHFLSAMPAEVCRLNLSPFAADVLRARVECRVISHVLAAHLHPCTATTPVGLLLVKHPSLSFCGHWTKVHLILRLLCGCSAPMPYLIGVHTSLSEVICT